MQSGNQVVRVGASKIHKICAELNNSERGVFEKIGDSPLSEAFWEDD